MTGTTAQPTHAPRPQTKGNEWAPVTLENTSGEKRNATTTNNKALGEEGGKK